MALSTYAIAPTIRTSQGKTRISYLGDGATHLNIHLTSRVALGRQLCMAYRHPIYHPIYKDFLSMEGLRRYATQHTQNEKLRTAHGLVGILDGTGKLKASPVAHELISRQAIHCLFVANTKLYDEFMALPSMPICSYYYFGNTVKDNFKREKGLVLELGLIHQGKALNPLCMV